MDRIKYSGFTLIEVIAVLVLLGIISAIAVSKVNVTEQSELYMFATELRSDLRYAQNNAMSTESICALVFTGNSYKFQDGNSNDQVLPGENQISLPAPSGVTVTPTSSLISFDAWGRPGTNRTDSDSDGLLDNSVASSITISNSSDSITLVITQETGYITQ